MPTIVVTALYCQVGASCPVCCKALGPHRRILTTEEDGEWVISELRAQFILSRNAFCSGEFVSRPPSRSNGLWRRGRSFFTVVKAKATWSCLALAIRGGDVGTGDYRSESCTACLPVRRICGFWTSHTPPKGAAHVPSAIMWTARFTCVPDPNTHMAHGHALIGTAGSMARCPVTRTALETYSALPCTWQQMGGAATGCSGMNSLGPCYPSWFPRGLEKGMMPRKARREVTR